MFKIVAVVYKKWGLSLHNQRVLKVLSEVTRYFYCKWVYTNNELTFQNKRNIHQSSKAHSGRKTFIFQTVMCFIWVWNIEYFAPQASPQATSASHSNIKMFSHTLTLAITVMPLLAAANPINTHNSTCSSGPVQCCDTTALAGSPKGADALKGIHVVVEDVNVLLGLQCMPISIIGVGIGGSCNNQAVCCQDNSHTPPMVQLLALVIGHSDLCCI
ncbi:hypothetical protein C8Q74DRAFT_1222051 [Fomes fomentarius]|nr:hypothetical protein C8Q74DRAFT_1222051 [Fomes fomentarius]